MKIPHFISIIATVGCLHATPNTLSIAVDPPAANASPMLYGLMTEEINFCYDGGLYAELVRNRAFLDDAHAPTHWSAVAEANISLDPQNPLNEAIPTSLKLVSTRAGGGVTNSGYWGIPVTPSTPYRVRFLCKSAAEYSGLLKIAITSEDGSVIYAQAEAPAPTNAWKPISLTLTTAADAPSTTKARLSITMEKPGTVWLSLVSLFPPTWKDRPNGLRKDLMQMLVDLKPAFLRFPGGNYLEGDTVDTRFEWKKTLGPITSRPGHQGPWGYRSTDGMGLMEFLLWCEDMGAEPVLGLYAGYSLKGAFIKPGHELDPFVQEALEEIEYVMGPTTSTWGARRAKDGHPQPFKLHYVEIGNEDWFDKSGSYDGRFAQFYDAIKKRYPQLKCISSVGGEQPENKRVHSRKPDVLDEHFYRTAEEFLNMGRSQYDKTDRKGPEIFVGEWAAHETPHPPWDPKARLDPATPNMKAAIGDAAFMTMMERNSDIVTMHCYAPLFVNLNQRQWRPDLIGYDALHAYGSPSYYAIRMFSTNLGDQILTATLNPDSPLHRSVTRDSKTGKIFIKLVNSSAEPQELNIELKGAQSLAPTAEVETLSAAPDATNAPTEPRAVLPATSTLSNVKPSFSHTLPSHSITVLKLSAR